LAIRSIPAKVGGDVFISAWEKPQSIMRSAAACLLAQLSVSGTACETLASSAARAASPPVRRSCGGRLTCSQKCATADCPARCSGRRSTKQTRALRHLICGVERSSLPSSRKSKEGRHRTTTRKDESPIACVRNPFTHERPPFTRTAAYKFITRFSGNFEATRRAASISLLFLLSARVPGVVCLCLFCRPMPRGYRSCRLVG